MKLISLEIITPSKTAYNDMVKSVSLPGTLGNFQVLFNHAPLLSKLEVGKIKIEDGSGKLIEFATSGGSVEVLNNKVLVLAETLESKEEIDIERAKKAYHRAKERLARKTAEVVDIARAEAALARAINRIKFAGGSLL